MGRQSQACPVHGLVIPGVLNPVPVLPISCSAQRRGDVLKVKQKLQAGPEALLC